MPQTTSAAVKQFIEGNLGLGLVVYADRASQQAKRPYVVVLEQITLVGDPPEDGKAQTGVETVQVDLYQDYRDLVGVDTGQQGKLRENYSLAPQLRWGLDGSRLAGAGGAGGSLVGSGIVYYVKVASSFRQVDENINEVRESITLEVFRGLSP